MIQCGMICIIYYTYCYIIYYINEEIFCVPVPLQKKVFPHPSQQQTLPLQLSFRRLIAKGKG